MRKKEVLSSLSPMMKGDGKRVLTQFLTTYFLFFPLRPPTFQEANVHIWESMGSGLRLRVGDRLMLLVYDYYEVNVAIFLLVLVHGRGFGWKEVCSTLIGVEITTQRSGSGVRTYLIIIFINLSNDFFVGEDFRHGCIIKKGSFRRHSLDSLTKFLARGGKVDLLSFW